MTNQPTRQQKLCATNYLTNDAPLTCNLGYRSRQFKVKHDKRKIASYRGVPPAPITEPGDKRPALGDWGRETFTPSRGGQAHTVHLPMSSKALTPVYLSHNLQYGNFWELPDEAEENTELKPPNGTNVVDWLTSLDPETLRRVAASDTKHRTGCPCCQRKGFEGRPRVPARMRRSAWETETQKLENAHKQNSKLLDRVQRISETLDGMMVNPALASAEEGCVCWHLRVWLFPQDRRLQKKRLDFDHNVFH